jgi:hypothetical protein
MTTQTARHWKPLLLSHNPPPFTGSAMCYDKARQHVLLLNGATDTNNTWLWNGVAWCQARIQKAPPARNSMHLVFDPQTQSILLFGGVSSKGDPLNDTWLWDGAAWRGVTLPNAPSPVAGGSIAYDERHQQVVLFGGLYGERPGTVLNETWVWNGKAWEEIPIGEQPAPRFGASMIYDAKGQQLLLFGGFSQSAQLNDTWKWTGTTWQQVSVAIAPQSRAWAQGVFHEADQHVFLFGGIHDGVACADTWMWAGDGWQDQQRAIPADGFESVVYDGRRNTLLAFRVAVQKAHPPAKGKNAAPNATPAAPLPVPVVTSETWIWE